MSNLNANGVQLFGAFSMGGKNSVINYEGIHSFIVGQKITIEGFATSGFNVVGQLVTTASPGNFSLNNPIENFTADNPTGAFGMEIDGTIYNISSASVSENLVTYYYQPYNISAASVADGMVTYVCDNNFMIGQIISITGFSDNTTYNVNNAQVMSVTPTQFTIASMGTIGSTSNTGFAYPTLLVGQTVTITGLTNADSSDANYNNQSFNLSGVKIASVASDSFSVYNDSVYGTVTSGGFVTLNVEAFSYLDVRSDTTYLYKSIPEYIQNWDAKNNFQLASWLDGAMATLQPVDDWARDSENGIGWSLLFNAEYYRTLSSYNDLNNALTVLPWLAQFLGTRLPLIPQTTLYNSSFMNEIQYVQSVQPYINRWIDQIETFNSFERGTLLAFINSLSLFLAEMNNLSNPVPTDQIIVLERTNAINYPNVQYVLDPYSVVVLIPREYLLTGTYGNIYNIANTYNYYNTGTPSTSKYPYYDSIPQTIIASRPPSTSFFGQFLSVSVPAGINVNVLPI